MFGVTSKYLAPQRALALLVAGGACAGLAACSSSASSSSTSAPLGTPTAAMTSASAPASTGTAAGAIPAADCTIIKQVSSGAITALTPLSTESTAKAAAAIAKYITQLKADQAKLTSSAGKAVLTSWIATVQKATTESTANATGTMESGLTTLGSACP